MTKKPRKRSAEASGRMLDVLGQFRIIINAIRNHYREVERASGISGAHLWALSHAHAHAGCTVGELAKALAIHMSTASNLIRRLESLKLIERRKVADDQRVVRLHVTRKGAAIVSKAPRPLIGVLQQALSSLPEQRVAALHDDLEALIKCMKTVDTRAKSTPLADM